MEVPVEIEFHGVKCNLPKGINYDSFMSFAKILYGMTDIEMPKNKAAKWALKKARYLLPILKEEAGKL